MLQTDQDWRNGGLQKLKPPMLGVYFSSQGSCALLQLATSCHPRTARGLVAFWSHLALEPLANPWHAKRVVEVVVKITNLWISSNPDTVIVPWNEYLMFLVEHQSSVELWMFRSMFHRRKHTVPGQESFKRRPASTLPLSSRSCRGTKLQLQEKPMIVTPNMIPFVFWESK